MDYMIIIVVYFIAGMATAGSLSDSSQLRKNLCKYEIEYCSKEELLKRMKDK